MDEQKPSPCACVQLRRAAQAATALYDKALAPSGLKVTQYSLLRAVARAGTATVSELAAALALDRTTLARNLQPLLRRGLLRVAEGDDRRVREVSLTVAGRDAMERAVPLWRAAQAAMEARVGAAGLDELLAGLAAVQAG